MATKLLSIPCAESQAWTIRRPDGRLRRLYLGAIILLGLILPITAYLLGGGQI